jgi:hypothetical protein
VFGGPGGLGTLGDGEEVVGGRMDVRFECRAGRVCGAGARSIDHRHVVERGRFAFSVRRVSEKSRRNLASLRLYLVCVEWTLRNVVVAWLK